MTVLYRPKLIWITRTAPGCYRIANVLRREGLRPLALPALQVHSIAPPRPKIAPQAIVFTSAHALWNHPVQTGWQDLPVFALGERTADAVLARGYRNVRCANGTIDGLKKLIETELPSRTRLLIVGGTDGAADLDEYLLSKGYAVECQAVYHTRHSTDAELREALRLIDSIEGISVYSAKAAERVAQLLRDHPWHGTIFCLSETCADRIPVGAGQTVLIADEPNEGALRKLVHRTWRSVPYRPGRAATGSGNKRPSIPHPAERRPRAPRHKSRPAKQLVTGMDHAERTLASFRTVAIRQPARAQGPRGDKAMSSGDRKSEDQAAIAARVRELKQSGDKARPHPPTGRHASEGKRSIPRENYPPSGAFDAEGHRVVVERSRKVR